MSLRPLSGAPLDPTGSDAHEQLRRELLKADYHQRSVFQDLYDRLDRALSRGLSATSRAPAVSVVFAVALLVLLVVVLALLVSRVRRTRAVSRAPGAVLSEEGLTAAQLRARAERSLAAGLAAEALVDGFRAITVRQVERGRLDDVPGATAYEVAQTLAREYPDRGAEVGSSARLFDEVLYGERPASSDQARAVLALDDELAVAR